MLYMWRAKQLLALALCAFLLSGCAQEAPAETVEFITVPEKEYKTTTVVRGPIDITLEENASLVYVHTKTLEYEYDDAILKESVSFAEGDVIKKGDVLATFTFEVSDAELQRMELDYIEDCATAEDKIASYESRIAQYAAAAAAGGIEGRIAALQKEKAENELIIYRETTYRQLLQQLNELEAYREKFTEKTLVAPEDGVVTGKVSVTAETVCSKGAHFLTYAPEDTVYLRLESAQEAFLLMATPGMTVTVSRGTQETEGTIVASPTGIDDNLDNNYIYIQAPNLSELGSRSYYNIDFTILSLDNMLLLDERALRSDENGYYVMVLQDGVAVRQEVIWALEGADMVCILDGLTEGQQVIIRN